jgi:hypothetical protein
MIGSRERAIDVAIAHGHKGRHIGGEVAMGMHGALGDRVAAIAHRGERFVVDRDGVGGVFREVAVIGDHHRDGLAHIADLVPRQRQLGAHRRDGGVRHRRRDRIGGEPARHVGGRQHRMDARHRQRRRHVDRADTRMRMRAAHETRLQHARQLDVVDETRTSGQQRGIFDPRHSCTELLRPHERTPATLFSNATPCIRLDGRAKTTEESRLAHGAARVAAKLKAEGNPSWRA